eukprot:m.28981 g.28981  ORF g.28981 m.28981 type:complete len:601 (+) comp31118_c0_seq3:488-2290(+)
MLTSSDILPEIDSENFNVPVANRKSAEIMSRPAEWTDNYDIVVGIEKLEDLVKEGWEIRIPDDSHVGPPHDIDSRPRGAAAIAEDIRTCSLPKVKWDQVDFNESVEEEQKANNLDPAEVAAAQCLDHPPVTTTVCADSRKMKRYSTIFVAVLGLYNKGKTYVLNHLADTNLPHGSAYHTQGICMKTPRNRHKSKMTFIDTAGFDFPVKVVNAGETSSIQMKKMVDQFIADVALRLSTVCIVVMNDITLYDQIYLEGVRDTLQHFKQENSQINRASSTEGQGKYGELVVVHNFALCEDLEDCRKAFEEQVCDKYPGSWRDQFLPGTKAASYQFWYTEEKSGRKVGMRHVFIGRCTDPTGTPWFKPRKKNVMQLHNESTFLILESWVQGYANETTFEPLEKIVQCTNDILPRYIVNPPNVKLAVKKNKDKTKSLTIKVAKKGEWDPDLYPPTGSEQQKTNLLMMTWKSPLTETVSTMQMNAPTYDIATNQKSVLIFMDRVVPLPEVEFDPISKICTIQGRYAEPSVYQSESAGIHIEHRNRKTGEYELKIDLTRHLSHNVALQMSDYEEDPEENLIFLTFQKINKVRFTGPKKNSLISSLKM